MASLILRGSTYYIQHYVSGSARRVSTATGSLQIAKEKLRQFESAQARGDDLPLPTKTPIPDILTAYVAHVRATKTANRYREILTRLFNWAMTQHGVRMPRDKNPAAAVERYREHAPEITFLTLAQIAEQLDALAGDAKLQATVATLIFAGLRREELIWLTVDDLDLTSGPFGVIRIRAKTVGKASWQPKTKRNRAVPISSRLRVHLDRWRATGVAGPWLFPNGEGGRYDPDNYSRDLRVANAARGLSWTNLDYRHTFGSQLAMKGESLFKIATLMGNSPEICRRHYAALVPEMLGDSVEFPSSTSGLQVAE